MATLAAAGASCRNASSTTSLADTGAVQSDEQIVNLVVFSGRPQPPSQELDTRIGRPLVVRTRGIGPPRVTVFGPDGSRIPTTDAPLLENGAVVGTEQRLLLRAAGAYRLEHAEVNGLILARLTARVPKRNEAARAP